MFTGSSTIPSVPSHPSELDRYATPLSSSMSFFGIHIDSPPSVPDHPFTKGFLQNHPKCCNSTTDSVGFTAISLIVGDHIQVQCSLYHFVHTRPYLYRRKTRKNPFNSIKQSVIQKMSFEIGESVEVIDNEDGMEGSYFKGHVIGRSPGRRSIRYDTLIADDGSPLEEVISVRRLRPTPPTVLARFHLGDMVDA
ncbi:hypothetical protein LXL04_019720 [Taraxacum kok-saghyz]